MRTGIRQRQDQIMTQLYSQSEVSAAALARYLGVSEATIRRDLRSLARAGQVVLSYGGAVLSGKTDFSFRSKAARNVQAKMIIGKLAAALASDGDQVFLDSGTTCAAMAPYLKAKRALSVIATSA